ncbi:MAG: YjbH domain-containing protein, partial [Kiloniellales bacterium]|nr:YjbH domain-containing protein [Kiloniellales bacterium]
WDFTFGLAWGNAGSRGNLPNPYCELMDRFCDRDEGSPGALNVDFFRGDRMSAFGGIEYLTPIEGLRLKVEYDGNDYSNEPRGNEFNVSLPLNVGVEYNVFSWMRLSAGLERGNEFMVRGSFRTNLNKDMGVTKVNKLPPLPVTPRKDRTETAFATSPFASAEPDRGTGDWRAEAPDMAGTPSASAPLDSESGSAAGGETLHVVGVQRVTFTASALSIQPVGLHAGMRPVPSPDLDGIRGRLAKFDLASADAEYRDREVLVRVPLGGSAPTNASLATAALDVANASPGVPIEKVTFIAARGAEEIGRTSFSVADLKRSKSLTHSAIALAPPTDPSWPELFVQDQGAEATPTRVALASAGASPGDPGAARFPREVLEQVASRVFAELKAQGFKAERLDMEGRQATLHFSQGSFRNPAISIGRAGRILARHTPFAIEEFRLVITSLGIPITQTSLFRKDLESAVAYEGSTDEIWQHTTIESAALPDRDSGVVNRDRFPSFEWYLSPRMRQQIGGPDNFFFYQVYGEAFGQVQLAPGLTLSGAVAQNIYNNFDSLELDSDSRLPRVRSDIAEYLKEGDQWIDRLNVNYITKVAPDVYTRLSGGIFELMYTGVGGEVLYRPTGKRWAVGLDANYVWQRDFEGRFGLRDYDVFTGHVSTYYVIPYFDILAVARGGRYLAGDWGGTLELSRTFKNGATIGVFATKTNVSDEQFGEGDFDKGFFVSFPLDLLLSSPSRRSFGVVFRPVTRDGGQRVATPTPLYGFTEGADFRHISEGWDELLD